MEEEEEKKRKRKKDQGRTLNSRFMLLVLESRKGFIDLWSHHLSFWATSLNSAEEQGISHKLLSGNQSWSIRR